MVVQQYSETSTGLFDSNLCAPKKINLKKEHGISIQREKSHGGHVDASTKCIPICLSDVKWSIQQGVTTKQLAFTKCHGILFL